MIAVSDPESDDWVKCRASRFPERGRSVVYALLDADLEPIYVGRTDGLRRRLVQHRSSATWWGDVRYVSWWRQRKPESFQSNETRAISALAPPHNLRQRRLGGRERFERGRSEREGVFAPKPLRYYHSGHIDRWIAAVIDKRPGTLAEIRP